MKARLLDASMVSGFWPYDNTPDWRTEIDIVESPAGAPGHEYAASMNLHVFHTPACRGTVEAHLVSSGTWIAPFRFGDAYHVYGLE